MDEEDLKKVFYNNAVLDIDDNDKEIKYYIQKNNTKILLGKVKKIKSKANKNCERDKKKFEEYGKLPNLLECIFKIKLSNYDEPLLLSGPTCYKTYVATMILDKKADIVSLNQESTIPQLSDEAKETNSKTSFSLENIHTHQIKHLERIHNHKGIAFLIIKYILIYYLLFKLSLIFREG